MSAATLPEIHLVLNGKRAAVRAHPMKRLLDVLREDCGLTGAKEGCGEGECGACTVILDGQAVNACLIPIGQAAGARITTIEGLRGRHRLQAAFAEHGGAQCGICTPGMILAAVALGPHPTLEQVRTGLAGNICRCTGYEGIYRAITAAQQKEVRSQQSAVRRKSKTLRPVGERSVRADARAPNPPGAGAVAKAAESRVPPASPKPARRRRAGEGGRS